MKRVIFILLLGLLLLGTVTRFLWLDRFPVGISHDEAEVLLSAKTYWLFGTDISSTSFPKSIFTNLTSGGLSGLPSFLLTPILGWQRLSLGEVRLPYVLINLLTLMFLVLLIYQLSRSSLLALITF